MSMGMVSVSKASARGYLDDVANFRPGHRPLSPRQAARAILELTFRSSDWGGEREPEVRFQAG